MGGDKLPTLLQQIVSHESLVWPSALADLAWAQATLRQQDIMDYDKSHQFTAAQAQAAEDRVVKLKDLQDEVWELLSKADALAGGLKQTACDFMSSQIQRAIGTPWGGALFDCQQTGYVVSGNQAQELPGLDEELDPTSGRNIWLPSKWKEPDVAPASQSLGHVPLESLRKWEMGSLVAKTALDVHLPGLDTTGWCPSLHTICSLNALSDLLKHRAAMLEHLTPLINLRKGIDKSSRQTAALL